MKKLRCEECGTPYAALQKGVLVIESIHHGRKHVNVIAVWDLVLMVLKQISGEAVQDEDEMGSD